jgi:tripartite-type tricarboxylate transporter receptor subunit TctC
MRLTYRPGRVLAPVAAAFMAVAAYGPANAQFPDHDITFIVPYSPGGGSDQQARRLQPGLEEALGVGVQIVYKEGGGGAVGFLELHSSAPDGYTIANVVVPNIIVTSRGEDVGYKPDEFSYIGMTERAPGALVVPGDSEFEDLDALVAYAKENPGTLTIAGTGSAGQANFAELVHALGIEATYVPVSGGVGDIIPYLQGGHVDAAVISSSHAARHAGTIKALGIAGDEASPALEGVPTLASAGYEGFEMATTWGVMAPPGTPDDVVAVLNEALRKVTSDEKVQDAQVEGGLTPMSQTPEEAKQYVLDAIAGVERNAELVEALTQ